VALSSPAALPPEALKLVETYQSDIAKIQAKSRQETSRCRDQVIAALQDIKDAHTARGELQAALAIKAKIEAIASDRDPDTEQPASHAGASLAAAANAVARDVAEKLSSSLEQITEADWDRLGGVPMSVDAHAIIGAVDTGLDLKPGDTLLVVPNANDKWRCGTTPSDNAPMNYQGDVAKDPHGIIRWGCLFVQIGDKIVVPGLITGNGRMWLKCNDGSTADNSGVIRVKILRVTP
jgi:vacuolar-type H+-ATPase subunit E/Vma4